MFYLERFEAQLNLYVKMLDEIRMIENEPVDSSSLDSIFNLIIARKYDEYHVEKDPNIISSLSDGQKNNRKNLYEITNSLIKSDGIAKQIYKDMTVFQDDGKIVLRSSNKIKGIMALISQRSTGELGTNEQKRYKIQSICVSVCSSLETMCFDLLREYYLNLPNNNKIDKTIPYDRIMEFTTIDDVKKYIIDEHVTSIFRGSLETWIDKVGEIFCVKKVFSDYKKDLKQINEFFQRRNLFVHTGGKVSWYYIRNTDASARDGEIENELIVTKEEYVNRHITLIREIGYKLFYCYLRMANHEDPNQYGDKINDFLVNRIKQQNNASPEIFKSISADNCFASELREVSRLNFFLYHRIHKTFEYVKSDLIKYDTKTLELQFKMAKSILLELDDALVLTKKFFDDLDDGAFLLCHDWPLISLVRNDPNYKEYFETNINRILGIKKRTRRKRDVEKMNLLKMEQDEYKEVASIPVDEVDVVVDYSEIEPA